MSKQDPRCLNSNDTDCIERLTLCLEGLTDCLETTEKDQETVDVIRQIGESAIDCIEQSLAGKQAEIDEIRKQVKTAMKMQPLRVAVRLQPHPSSKCVHFQKTLQ